MTSATSPSLIGRLLFLAGGILVAASVAAAVVMSLDTGSSSGLQQARLLLSEGRPDEAERLLEALGPFSKSDLETAQAIRLDLELLREKEERRAEQQANVAKARSAVDAGRLGDAARALAGAGGLDRELEAEVGEALLERAEQSRRQWDPEEARQFLELAKKVFGERHGEELIEAELLVADTESRTALSAELLGVAERALEEGKIEVAQEALVELESGGYSPEARAEGVKLSGVLETHLTARDRQAVLTKVDKLLEAGQVTGARELLELHSRTTGNREFDARVAALKELEEAGGATSFLPVRNALRFLVKCQDKDGGYRVSSYQKLFPKDKVGGNWNVSYDLGVTGLALLAFTAFRDLDISGEFNAPAERCAKYLARSVNRAGNVTGNHYNEAIVALALLERTVALGRKKAKVEFKAAARIINYLTRSAQLPDGGWRYGPRGTSDSSVTCWVMQALDAARRADVELHGAVLQRGMDYLTALTSTEGWTGYTLPMKSPNMTAAALLVRQLFPEMAPEGSAELARGALLEYLKPPLDLSLDPDTEGAAVKKLLEIWPDHYGWYYTTYSLHKSGGSAWTAWGQLLANALLISQITVGELAGSWEPDRRWGRRAGRLYSTALNALSLEVYYR